jgi:hypothetical protein
MQEAERIPEGPIERLDVQAYRGVSSSFTLFEDEGLTKFELSRVGNRFSLASSGWRPKKNLRIIWR